jgi:GTP-binding protein HflX
MGHFQIAPGGKFCDMVIGRTRLKSLVKIEKTRLERAFLVGVELKSQRATDIHESLAELAELSQTAGAEVAGEGIQKMESLNAATFIGPGKAEEFSKFCKANKVDTVIFDDELSPAQSRNLEKIFNCKILDRTALILDIFAQRARTREGKLQIELAQLQHLLPRLTRFWGHLSRQSGGIGMRGGEGESQLEADRRKVSERIDRIERDLEAVRRQRETQRAGRQRSQWPLASIVGYTNAGKSTLLNQLTGAEVLAKDILFATLDPTTRRLKLPTNQNVLLTDTVGFIKKLAARPGGGVQGNAGGGGAGGFAAARRGHEPSAGGGADSAVNSVLAEIGAAEKPTIMIFNKVDQLNGSGAMNRLREQFPNSVAISARTGEGCRP